MKLRDLAVDDTVYRVALPYTGERPAVVLDPRLWLLRVPAPYNTEGTNLYLSNDQPTVGWQEQGPSTVAGRRGVPMLATRALHVDTDVEAALVAAGAAARVAWHNRVQAAQVMTAVHGAVGEGYARLIGIELVAPSRIRGTWHAHIPAPSDPDVIPIGSARR